MSGPRPPLQMPSEKRLMELLEAENKLCALEAAGVDNWAGYSEAMAQFYEPFDYFEDDAPEDQG